MARLMTLCADRLRPTSAVARRVLDWPGAVHAGAQSVPLRLAGALHGLVIDGTDPGLVAAYPPKECGDDALWNAVEAAFDTHGARMMQWLDQAPQTNEVRRSAVLIPALWWISGQVEFGQANKPLILSELGASAGLNLMLDRYALAVKGAVHGPADSPVRFAPDWTGPIPVPRRITVAGRAGVDLHPLDTADPATRLRLLAYLWPDQPDRRHLTEAAIAITPPVPDAGDATAWLKARLAERHPGHVHVVYNTVAWQYFPPETQAACRATLEAAGAAATPDAPLAHIAMEADGTKGSAALTVRLWPSTDPRPRLLARADFHGRRIDWQEKHCCAPLSC